MNDLKILRNEKCMGCGERRLFVAEFFVAADSEDNFYSAFCVLCLQKAIVAISDAGGSVLDERNAKGEQ